MGASTQTPLLGHEGDALARQFSDRNEDRPGSAAAFRRQAVKTARDR